MRKIRCVFLLVALADVASTACNNRDAAKRSTPTITDSAGVAIVSNSAPRWTESTRWTIDTVPFLSIGEEKNAAEPLTAIGTHLRLANGNIALVNNRTELRLYDSVGKLIQKVGRRGQGPGEYQTIDALFSCNGDSTLVVPSSRRFGFWSESGEFIRDLPQPTYPTRKYAEAVGASDDCAAVLARDAIPVPPGPQYINRLNWYRFNSTAPESLFTYPGNEVIMAMYNGQEWKQVPVWANHPQFVANAERIAVGLQDTPEFRDFDLRGMLKRVVRWKAPAPIPVTAQDRTRFDSLRDAFFKTDGEAPNLPPIALMPVAKTKPVYSRMMIDAMGNTWLCECADWNVLFNQISDKPDEGPWTVFDSTGVWLGTLKMPSGISVQRIGTDEIGAVWKDDDDVPRLRMFRIRKP